MSYKDGTRVRVTFEATVTSALNPRHPELPVVRVKRGDLFGLQPEDTIEVVTPEYELGEIYRGSNGCDYVRAPGGWRLILHTDLSAGGIDAQYEGVTFTRLVPEVAA